MAKSRASFSVLRLLSAGALVAALVPISFGAVSAAGADSYGARLKTYKPVIVEHIGIAVAGAKDLQAAIKAGDLKAAQAAWIKSRRGWEVMEPVTGTYFGDIDKLVDAWPDAKQGYHAIEVVLFKTGKTEGLEQPAADMLANLNAFQKRAKSASFRMSAQKLLEGTANLAYEVGEEKSKGGESPYAGTSIIDLQQNVKGIATSYKTVFADRLKKADPKLADLVQTRLDGLEKLVGVDDIKSMNQQQVHVGGEELAALLLQAAPKLGLKSFKLGEE